MKKPTQHELNETWLGQFRAPTLHARLAQSSTPITLSSSERKAQETTRVARQMIDTAAEERAATSARLRSACLAKEADTRGRDEGTA